MNMEISSSLVQVTTTADTRDGVERIARELIARRLAACVQIDGPIMSLYRWEERVACEQEWRCTVKTRESLLEHIYALVRSLHSYELPELIATPISNGEPAYLAWILEMTAGHDVP
jgi:periplasmic divalent cation tolerance protein